MEKLSSADHWADCRASRGEIKHLALRIEIIYFRFLDIIARTFWTYPLFRPPVRSNGRSSVLLVVLFFLPFLPTVLRVPSTDRPETLPPDRNLRVFYNASPKIRGHSPKNSGPKTCKISVDFGPLQTLIANVSETGGQVENLKSS